MVDDIMKPYCIVHLQLFPLLSGVQRVTLDELQRLKNTQKLWLVCQSEGPLTLEAGKYGCQVHNVPSLVREINPVKDFFAFWELWRFFRKEHFDVLHTHSSKTGVLGRLAAKLAGVSCIVHTVHGFAFAAAKSKFQKKFFVVAEWLGGLCADKVICLHSEDARICHDEIGIPAHKIVVLANGIDLHKFRPLTDAEKKENIRAELSVPVSRKLILMVGRLWEQKNPECLISAYCQLWSSGDPGADLVIVGDGELQDSLVDMVKKADLIDNVHFLGWRSDIPELLRVSDIFALPSRWEGMPLAILEAMASGLPVVASDIPGNRHLVENNKYGFLFTSDDSYSLASCLIKLLRNKELRVKQGKAGRTYVEEKHDINKRVQYLELMYHQALGG